MPSNFVGGREGEEAKQSGHECGRKRGITCPAIFFRDQQGKNSGIFSNEL